MFSRSGYQALPLSDVERCQSSRSSFFSSGATQDSLKQVLKETDTPQGCLSCICHGLVTTLVFLFTILFFPISGWFVLKVIPAYERAIVFRLGRIRAPQGPGMVLLLPFIDHWQTVDLRTRAFSVPPCKLTSRDGALVSVGADVQFRIWDPALSVMMVKDLNVATRMTAQNIMTKVLLKKYLREIQTEKLRIAEQLLLEINDTTRSWGLEVDRVELILEGVFQTSQENATRPLSSAPLIPGLDSTFQQLALHFFSSTAALGATHPKGGSETGAQMEIENEVAQTALPLGTSPSNSGERRKLDATEVLRIVQPFLSESLVNQVRACYQIDVLLPGGTKSPYFIDLSAGCGRAGPGPPDRRPDVVLEMAESDLEAFVLGKLHPLSAYVCGWMRVQGDLNVALKLEELLKAMKQGR
ncbi:Stomatin-like protein 1 [Varanus komodoensis]|uniref:Stomatin like 1 n=1 Tax=Varanus komodoensis TaxID=61221 RepID=A0A8D2IRI4_VARKO|nr:stomatin-like protein 1 [Varanus komodoensis]XP_044306491.1 stomatin-like protein 1 [Varanus komodoensis]XP_044306492.1 stomatin-like protein 1 [Varanus komodoensis]KAF7237772.1 Stomatin-like protein 1 [Varanus komodoensis]